MPRPKTGNPVGRPATYAPEDKRPVTVSLRIPYYLAVQMKRYASIHRQSITELLLDGLKWRIGEGEHYGNTDMAGDNLEDPGQAGVLQEIRTALQTLTQALEHRPPAAPPETYYSNTAKGASPQQSTPSSPGIPGLEPTHEGGNTVLQEYSKAAIVARLQAMRDQGMSLKQMADQLTAEGIPTATGKPAWAKGTVDKLLHGR